MIIGLNNAERSLRKKMTTESHSLTFCKQSASLNSKKKEQEKAKGFSNYIH